MLQRLFCLGRNMRHWDKKLSVSIFESENGAIQISRKRGLEFLRISARKKRTQTGVSINFFTRGCDRKGGRRAAFYWGGLGVCSPRKKF